MFALLWNVKCTVLLRYISQAVISLVDNLLITPDQEPQTHEGEAASLRYFDAINDEWLKRYHEKSPAGYALRVRKARLLELLDPSGGRILDVGCGPGVMAQDLVAL